MSRDPVPPPDDVVPWRDHNRCRYFVKDRSSGLSVMDFPEACIAAAVDRQKVYAAYSLPNGDVRIVRGGRKFVDIAKRAIRSAQTRDENPPCQGFTSGGRQCRALAVAKWRGIDVCAMHDPEGLFAKTDADYRRSVLTMLRSIKDVSVDRLNDRLTALLLERYGPGKGRY